jgi:entry exclusion lipoprotein TrbK
MNFKFSVVGMIGLCLALIGCDGVPEANSVNCSGRGLESSLSTFRNDEAARQAFVDKCDEINKGK